MIIINIKDKHNPRQKLITLNWKLEYLNGNMGSYFRHPTPLSLLHNNYWIHCQHYSFIDCSRKTYYIPIPMSLGVILIHTCVIVDLSWISTFKTYTHIICTFIMNTKTINHMSSMDNTHVKNGNLASQRLTSSI